MSKSLGERTTTIRPALPSGKLALPPASNTPGGADTGMGDDHNFALSLRLLTVLVLAALGGSIAFLAYRSLTPALPNAGAAYIHELTPRSQAPDPHVKGSVKPPDEVLMAPNRVFRCEERGQVTFSDEACANGKTERR